LDNFSDRCNLYLGKSEEILRTLPDNSVDSVVTDPPYHLTSIVKRSGTDGASERASRGFMGKEWDGGDIAFRPEFWAEVLRVLKPGGHLLAFSGSRTYHRMACGIEDAGFEIRDSIMWLYGSGFPKSHDVSKGIDKAAGAEREVVGRRSGAMNNAEHSLAASFVKGGTGFKTYFDITTPATPDAQQWQGWGSALKPAHEPICVARKPLVGTIAENVLQYGTGALNIDGCRVGRATDDESGWSKTGSKASDNRAMSGANYERAPKPDNTIGRWPANVIHDGSDEVLAGFAQSSVTGKRSASSKAAEVSGTNWLPENHESTEYTDAGSVARFFYCAKTSKADREEGLENFKLTTVGDGRPVAIDNAYQRGKTERRNTHPTVKPTELMRYLCRLVTPLGGLVLDPFMGSGSTGKAAMLEGFRFIGIDMTEEYHRIAEARIRHAYDGKNKDVDK